MRSIRLAAFICAASLPLAAFATPVTLEYTGRFDQFAGTIEEGGDIFHTLYPYNTEFTALVTYDDETPALFQSLEFTQYVNSILGATISVGVDGSLGVFNLAPAPTNPFEPNLSSMVFLNDVSCCGGAPFDQFFWTATLANQPGDPSNRYWNLGFSTFDYDLQHIHDGQSLLDPLPSTTSPSPNGFAQFSLGYTQFTDPMVDYKAESASTQVFSVRRIETAGVPEPGTWSLFIAGLVALWLATRRRAPFQRGVPNVCTQ